MVKAYEFLTTAGIAFEEDAPYFAKCFVKSEGNQGPVNDATETGDCAKYVDLPDHPHNEKPCKCWSSRPKVQPSCPDMPATKRRSEVLVSWSHIKAFGPLSTQKQQDLIMHHIMEGGPVSAAFRIWDDFRNFVSMNPTIPYRRHEPEAKTSGGHAIVIIGWGESTEDPPVPYWWIRNSWGKDFALQGYFKVARGANVGLEASVVFGEINSRLPRSNLSEADFGIRPAWQNGLVGFPWGRVEQDSNGTLKYVKGPELTGDPRSFLDITVHSDQVKVLQDTYVDSDLISGVFKLITLRIPVTCSSPCTVGLADGFRTYPAINATSRFSDFILDDDSWTAGFLQVYISKDDPIQGTSAFELKLEVKSSLQQQLLLEYPALTNYWGSVPHFSQTVSVILPHVAEHRKASTPLAPIVPMKVDITALELKLGQGICSIPVVSISARSSYQSTFRIRILDADTQAEILPSTERLQTTAGQFVFAYFGSYTSLGGGDFRDALMQDGVAHKKNLQVEVTASCTTFQIEQRAFTSKVVAWPEAPATGLDVSIGDVKLVEGAISIAIESNLASIWSLTILDRDTEEVILPRTLAFSEYTKPKQKAVVFVGRSYNSVGGDEFAKLFSQDGKGFKRKLRFQVKAVSNDYRTEQVAEASKDFVWPEAPETPLQVSLDALTVVKRTGCKVLSFVVRSSDDSTFFVKIEDLTSGEVYLPTTQADGKPTQTAYLYFGGWSSLGGSALREVLAPGGKAYRRGLRVHVIAVCDQFVKQSKAFTIAEYQPQEQDS